METAPYRAPWRGDRRVVRESISPQTKSHGRTAPVPPGVVEAKSDMPNELKWQRGRGVIARYREFLPVSAAMPVVSLGEGETPLIFSPRLSERVGRGCEVFVKYEGLNPTGSFKDRGMTVAVSKAVEQGARTLICASTGNTSASAAAYAARAGIGCAVVLPAGKIASGKMAAGVCLRSQRRGDRGELRPGARDR